MKKIAPFTKENYPKGYSRSDVERELAMLERQRVELNERFKSITRDSKRLQDELKRGGRFES